MTGKICWILSIQVLITLETPKYHFVTRSYKKIIGANLNEPESVHTWYICSCMILHGLEKMNVLNSGLTFVCFTDLAFCEGLTWYFKLSFLFKRINCWSTSLLYPLAFIGMVLLPTSVLRLNFFESSLSLSLERYCFIVGQWHVISSGGLPISR